MLNNTKSKFKLIVEGTMYVVPGKKFKPTQEEYQNFRNFGFDIESSDPFVWVVFSDKIKPNKGLIATIKRKFRKIIESIYLDNSDDENLKRIFYSRHSVNWNCHGFNSNVKRYINESNLKWDYCYPGLGYNMPIDSFPLNLIKDKKEGDEIEFQLDEILFRVEISQSKSKYKHLGSFEEIINKLEDVTY